MNPGHAFLPDVDAKAEHTLHATLSEKLRIALEVLDGDPPPEVASRTIAKIADLRSQLRCL